MICQMSGKPKHKGRLGRQYAALPLKEQAGEALVMLVTSRETGRWVLPKGWAEKRLTGAQVATKEAYEEAGILGETQPEPIGSYGYVKKLPKGRAVECTVKVFPLKVAELLDTWPEVRQRRREWFTLAEAATQVEEGELVAMLLHLAEPKP